MIETLNTNRRKPRARTSDGSMIGMVALVGGILILACVVGFCFYMLIQEQNKGELKAEQTAVDMAKILNEGDRVGQLNNVVARSRELVYLSRLSENQAAQKKLDNWEPLARFLVDEARAGSVLVEAERKNQIEVSRKNIKFFIDKYNLNTKNDPTFRMPFFHTWDAEINDATLGSVAKCESNVLNTDIYPELREYDEQQRYFQKGSNLYMGNINARLPVPDNDLDFKLASLPAPVEKTIAPARLINGSVFKPGAEVYKDLKTINKPMEHIPTAVSIIERIWVTAMSSDEQQMAVGAAASANGADIPPE